MSNAIEDRIEAYKSTYNILKKVGEEKKLEMYRETTDLIKYMNSMSNDMESRRTAICDDAVKKITFTVPMITTLCAIMSQTSLYNLYFLPLLGFGIAMFVASLSTTIYYWIQSESRYVFKDHRIAPFGNSWKWFYYGNPHIKNIKTRYWFKPKESAETLLTEYDAISVNAYFDGLKFLTTSYIDEADDTTAMVQKNIQQLFLMQVHNYYKNRHQMALARLNKRGSAFALIVLVCLIMLVVFVPSFVESLFING